MLWNWQPSRSNPILVCIAIVRRPEEDRKIQGLCNIHVLFPAGLEHVDLP